ncbi:MAG: alpha-L-fucosidase [Phycisphaerae bacterium]
MPTPLSSLLPLLFLPTLALAQTTAPTPVTPPPPAPRIPQSEYGISQLPNEKLSWLLDAKFGMFIHWGLYSVPAKGEWIQYNQAIPPDKYRQFAEPSKDHNYFDANDFHPDQWAQLATDAGMKWMCLTARHHDGFALFDLPFPNAFTSMQTLHRDLVAEYVTACRNAHLKVGLYFSPIDWRYPGYYDVTGKHCYPNNFGYTTDPAHHENARLMKEENYVAVKTLMTHYGHIDYIFWDGGWLAQRGSDADAAFFHEPGKFLDPQNPWPISSKYQDLDEATHKPLGIMGMVRKYQPDAITNLRYGWMGDIVEEEGPHETTGPIRSSTIWDKCLTIQMGGWGINADSIAKNKIMSSQDIISYLANCAIRDMVLLANVSPDRHGQIPELEQQRLREVGQWLQKNGDAIYGTRAGPWQPVDHQYGFTYKNNTLYLHLLRAFKGTDFPLPQLPNLHPQRIYTLATRTDLPHDDTPASVAIHNINRSNSPADTILAVEYDHPINSIWPSPPNIP